MARKILLFLTFHLALLLSGEATKVSVDDFGASGDGGITDDTQAFLEAWGHVCRSPEHATLTVPAGKAYLVGPANFTGPCRAHIDFAIEGSIIAPENPAAWDGVDPNSWLYFGYVDHLQLHGGGAIDGRGQLWWESSCKRNRTNPCKIAPKQVWFQDCNHIGLRNLSILNSQEKHLHFDGCAHVWLSRLTILAPGNSPNTDGVHVFHSRFVTVEHSIIATGDDCVSIVWNSSDVRVRDVMCGPGHGISIGSLGKANMNDRVKNVRISRCVLSGTTNGLRIKTWQGGSGYARNIVFKDIVMRNVTNPIIIDQYYCDQTTPCNNQTSAVQVEGVSYINVTGTASTKKAVSLACSDSLPCRGLFMKDVNLTSESGGEATAFCWKAFGAAAGYVYPPPCLSYSHRRAQNPTLSI